MNNRDNSDIPGEVYVQFVKSLYESRGTLLVGGVSHALIALMVFVSTGEPLFAVFAVLFLAIGFVRFAGIRRDRNTLVDADTARHWEADYVINGGLQGFLLGAFGFASAYIYPDQFGELGALAIILASLVTVVGRNYGSSRVVIVFTVTMLAPIGIAFLLRGQLNYAILAFLMLPFGLIVIKSAAAVRQILLAAVLQRRKADRLAQRFDRALNTMSHGLIMFNPEGRIVVANERAAEHLGYQVSEQMVGRTLDALLLRGVAGDVLSRNDFISARSELQEAMNVGHGRKVLLRLLDGRYIEFTAREGKEELAVLTFEEVTHRVEAEDKIRHMARYDSLTGLPNRAYFQEMVREFMAEGDRTRLCGLAIVDLDDFKSINDTLGHPVGDSLIYAVAERLVSCISEGVKIGRFGGDEFIIYVDDVHDAEYFTKKFDAIFKEILGEVEIAGHLLSVDASGGAVVFPVNDGDLDELTVRADLALYAAKDAGKMCWRLFEEHMDAAFRTRQTMKSDLRTAIHEKKLHVMYQPILDMGTLRVAAFEALCRWDHPEMGAVSPGVFIPLAEEMGLITEISTMVLETACAECVLWAENLGVSVNLSAKDFYGPSVVDKVANALSKSGLQPGRLELEVTETALLDDRQSTRLHIEELKALGACIALDDFGTGYSSLSYLHALPLDRVKVDGSFLHDIMQNAKSRKLLKSIVQLSHGLGLSVTIEGVETYEQLQHLQLSAPSNHLQGFLFGGALSAEEARALSDAEWPFENPELTRKYSKAAHH